MKGNSQIIEHLNRALGNELIAINQYFLHARTFEHWGFLALGKKEYEESIDEMKHADMLTKRILFLEGLPNLQDLGLLKIGTTVQEAIANDLDLELKARDDLIESIALCEKFQDYVSRDLLKVILANEEEHIDWLETQLELIEKVGDQNYLQTSMQQGEC